MRHDEAQKSTELAILFEHSEWQKPLFTALERRGVPFTAIDLKSGSFADGDPPASRVFFNQASPSAYVRGNARAVPFALALMRVLERKGARVLNGSAVFALELSKSAQAALLRSIGVPTPATVAFNDVTAIRRRRDIRWPALLKPEQGGSGARIEVIESVDHLDAVLGARPDLWLPDNLLLIQELIESDHERGIVRMEFLDGELLYAMRVVSHGRFNLCPAPVCNPESDDETSACEVTPAVAAPPVEFHPYPEVPDEAVETGRRIVRAAGLDVGGLEYIESRDGRLVFYDINANSNLRPSIAAAFGFDPFERVVDYLLRQLSVEAAGTREA